MSNSVHPLKGATSWVVTALMTVALGAGIVVANHHATPVSTTNATATAPSASGPNTSIPSGSASPGISATNVATAANAKPIVTYYKGDDSSSENGSSSGESASFGDN
ncbi:MAG TPA: hypothetical protein VNE22_03790 [Acidimicrobiales bacterium]|nr:hypothetical protein [Acidimicrobiales bacterium]